MVSFDRKIRAVGASRIGFRVMLFAAAIDVFLGGSLATAAECKSQGDKIFIIGNSKYRVPPEFRPTYDPKLSPPDCKLSPSPIPIRTEVYLYAPLPGSRWANIWPSGVAGLELSAGFSLRVWPQSSDEGSVDGGFVRIKNHSDLLLSREPLIQGSRILVRYQRTWATVRAICDGTIVSFQVNPVPDNERMQAIALSISTTLQQLRIDSHKRQ